MNDSKATALPTTRHTKQVKKYLTQPHLIKKIRIPINIREGLNTNNNSYLIILSIRHSGPETFDYSFHYTSLTGKPNQLVRGSRVKE